MQSKGEGPFKHDDFVQEYGKPEIIITNNAMEEPEGLWKKALRKYLLRQRTTEPYSSWQPHWKLES